MRKVAAVGNDPTSFRTAVGVEPTELAALLWEGASSMFRHEATVAFLIGTEYWLRHEQFLGFVEIYDGPPRAAGVHWAEAMHALHHGVLRAGQEESSILRIAASIATAYPVSIGEMAENIGRDAVRLMAEAVMYADGFLDAFADPR